MLALPSGTGPPLLMGFVILALLFIVQWMVATMRRRSQMARQGIDNDPVLLMDGEEILEENLKIANVTRLELYAKLREANALTFSQIRAVVMETTGDVSVLHSEKESPEFDEVLLEGVRRGPGHG